jgi:hypothetical protein
LYFFYSTTKTKQMSEVEQNVFSDLANNYQLKTLKLDILYRDDYNGRASAFLVSSYLLVKTHPFYIWGDSRKHTFYGRAYTYDVFKEQPIFKATVTDTLDIFHELYANAAVFNELLQKLGVGDNFRLRGIDFVKSDQQVFEDVYKSMSRGQLIEPIHGCLRYQNVYWILHIHEKIDFTEAQTEEDRQQYAGIIMLDEYFESLNLHDNFEYESSVQVCEPNLKISIGKVYSSDGHAITIGYLVPHSN